MNRLALWAAVIPMFLYILYLGQWVGATEEKIADHDNVERTQIEIKERLVRVEEGLEDLEKASDRDRELILDAIRRLEEKMEDNG